MRPSTIALLAVLAVTLIASWFFASHERITREEFTGYRGEARVNDFLAAELLLKQLEIDADARASMTPSDWVPDLGDTVVTRISANIAVAHERATLLAMGR